MPRAAETDRTKDTQLTPAEIEDDGTAPTVFTDGFAGILVRDGVARLNLYGDHIDVGTGKTRRKVITRLAMPLSVLVQVHEAIGNFIGDLESKGILERRQRARAEGAGER